MKLGIMSDSHDRADTVQAAIRILEDAGATHFIHCGGIEVFQEFVGRPLTFVWGNCDMLTQGLRAFLETAALNVPESVPTVCEFDGKRFAIFHGHESGFSPQWADGNGGQVDYILHGHTHMCRDERIGDVRVINPGALFRCRQKTVATLDVARDELQFIDVND